MTPAHQEALRVLHAIIPLPGDDGVECILLSPAMDPRPEESPLTEQKLGSLNFLPVQEAQRLGLPLENAGDKSRVDIGRPTTLASLETRRSAKATGRPANRMCASRCTFYTALYSELHVEETRGINAPTVEELGLHTLPSLPCWNRNYSWQVLSFAERSRRISTTLLRTQLRTLLAKAGSRAHLLLTGKSSAALSRHTHGGERLLDSSPR